MISLFLLLALLQAGEEAPPPAPSAQEAPDPTMTVKGADLGLLEGVRAIAGRVEQVRGERFRRPPIAVRAPELMRGVAAEIRAFNALPREKLAARGRAWADLGVGRADSPEMLLRAVAGDLEGIAFDPAGNRLLVGPERLTDDDFLPREEDDPDSTVLMMTGVRPDEPLVAHLLMHVRQLEREGRDSLEPTTDRLLAHAAWNEGEANLVAMRYLYQGMGLDQEVLALAPDPRDVLDGLLVPSSLNRLSGVEATLAEFVYLEGFALAVEQYVGGGWDGLERAMARRRTTSQMMHPGRAEPVEPELDPGSPEIENLELVDVDSLGEQAIFALVSALTGKDNLALQAGDGWEADRLYRWEPAEGERASDGVTLWVSVWRDEEQAAEFAYAMRRALRARFPAGGVDPDATGPTRLRAGGRSFLLESRGPRVRFRVAPAGAGEAAEGDGGP